MHFQRLFSFRILPVSTTFRQASGASNNINIEEKEYRSKLSRFVTGRLFELQKYASEIPYFLLRRLTFLCKC